MRLSARIKCFKYLVYAYMILISVCGSAQLVIGAFLLWTHRQYSPIVKNQFWEQFAALIVLGLISQLLCYLGWISTSRKHRCYLGTFCAVLVLFIVILFIVSGWAVATKANLIVPAELAIEASFTEFLSKSLSTDQTHLWNRLQRDFHCCGFNGIHDYKKVGVPWSCYDPINAKVYSADCMHVFVRSIEMNMVRVAVVAVCSALIQSLGIFCVIQLTMLLRRPILMLPNGDNHSTRVKPSYEQAPLQLPTHHHSNPASQSSSSSSTKPKPAIAPKPVLTRVDPPVIKPH
ncbi:tetraspanin-1 [Anopheles bellator]|uniref:tetraspanin-1 n=1 Tax=Anopheles bellator TaxID=139047 RepID=UPI002648233C|nr:tetraspanin-1 [Anopheles bellator]